jgi:hypothetical protein
MMIFVVDKYNYRVNQKKIVMNVLLNYHLLNNYEMKDILMDLFRYLFDEFEVHQ